MKRKPNLEQLEARQLLSTVGSIQVHAAASRCLKISAPRCPEIQTRHCTTIEPTHCDARSTIASRHCTVIEPTHCAKCSPPHHSTSPARTPSLVQTPNPVQTPLLAQTPRPASVVPGATVDIHHRLASLTAAGLRYGYQQPASNHEPMETTLTLTKPMNVQGPGTSEVLVKGTRLTIVYGPKEVGLINRLQSQY
jgi:hypothetical protein